MRFDHYIATRFNIQHSGWQNTKSGNEVLTENWLQNRFEIFEKYTLPAVLNQSSKNFKWCIFFDLNTSQVFKKKIQRLLEKHLFMSAIFIENYDELVPEFIFFIKQNKTSASYIITTRIDNDDIIHRDFVKTIQSQFRPSDLCVIDLRSGFQMSIDIEPIEIRNYNHPFNAFLSVIERVDNCSTIYSRQHYHWKNEKTIIFKKQRLWIELSHDENYVNHRQVKLKRVYSFDNKNFSLSGQFDIDVFGAIAENLRIDLISTKALILQAWNKLKKIPFRTRRWVLKRWNLNL